MSIELWWPILFGLVVLTVVAGFTVACIWSSRQQRKRLIREHLGESARCANCGRTYNANDGTWKVMYGGSGHADYLAAPLHEVAIGGKNYSVCGLCYRLPPQRLYELLTREPTTANV